MDNRCSFCKTPTDQVEKIIFGPEVNICSDCIRVCLTLIEGQSFPGWMITTSPQRCGNCGRRPSEGYRHFVNRTTYSPRICERCIGIFTDSLLKEIPSLDEEIQDIFERSFLKGEAHEDIDSDLAEQVAPDLETQMVEAMEPKPVAQQVKTDLNPPLGLLFDLGDTLLTQKGFSPDEGNKRVLEMAKNPGGFTLEEINRRLEEINRDLIPRREAAMVEFHPHLVQRHVYEAFNISFDCSQEEVELEFWQASMKWSPEPDIFSVLEAIKDLKIPMGIVSNAAFCSKTLTWELQQHDLMQFFSFLMSSADYWVRKPHPLILETAALKLEIEPARVWYIGNSPRYDVQGALNARMGAIWYNREIAPCDGPEPHVEVRSWKEFLTLIQKFV